MNLWRRDLELHALVEDRSSACQQRISCRSLGLYSTQIRVCAVQPPFPLVIIECKSSHARVQSQMSDRVLKWAAA